LAAFFPPLYGGEPAILEEREGDQCQERVPVQSPPGPPLEVVEAEFLLELLVGLLAYPARAGAG
jgi:hypothetical protein